VGDIGRYICRLAYSLELPKGRRAASYDGMIGPKRVAVRMNNCPTGTPVRLAEPLDFDELIVVLGPGCFLRPPGVAGDFICYRFSPDEVRARFRATAGGYIGGRDTFARGYDKVVDLTPRQAGP